MKYTTEQTFIPTDIPISFIEFQPINYVESGLAQNIADECIQIKANENYIVSEFYMRLLKNNICESKLSTLAFLYLIPMLEN